MNEQELKEKIERKVGPVSDGEWEKIIDLRSQADFYDEIDLKERLEKAKKIVGFSRKVIAEQKLQPPPATHYQASDAVAAKFQERAEKFRAFLGLRKPLELKDLEAWLTRQRGKYNPTQPTLDLFYSNKDNKEVIYILFNTTNKKLLAIKNEAKKIIRLTPWTEDEAVDFLLCGIIPLLPYISVTQHYVWGGHEYGQRPGLIIKVGDLNISAEVIRRVYVQARNEMLRSYLGRETTTPRPRSLTAKTAELIKFVAEYKELTWQERLKKWNDSKDDPKDKYASERSMAISFYKAKKKLGL